METFDYIILGAGSAGCLLTQTTNCSSTHSIIHCSPWNSIDERFTSCPDTEATDLPEAE